MPMQFTDFDIHEFLELTGCSTEGTNEEKRERAAKNSDNIQLTEVDYGRRWLMTTKQN